MNPQYYDVVVVGGGASGLMCALTAGYREKKVLVIDSSNKVGKKILMSGGGRCNFTNLFVEADNFISHNPHFCKSALSRYTQWDFIALVEKHRIPYHERKHGELFCDDSAKDILKMLLDECSEANVQIKTKCQINAIQHKQGDAEHYQLATNLGNFFATSLVIATGGLSIPTLGGSGFGYELAQQFNLPLKERRAGLVPFTFSDQIKPLTERLSGLAVDVEMETDTKNQNASFRENMLFTHRGISGPSALQLSNYWQTGEAIVINLLPEIDAFEWLLELKSNQPNALLRTLLTHKLTKNLISELQTLFWAKQADTPIGQFSDALLKEISNSLQYWNVKPAGTEGYRTAEVTLGGIDTNVISSKTMECKTQKGLYFIGEVLDVTGHLGGFNFQWAWASGVAAGESVK